MIPPGWIAAKLREVATIKRGAGSQYLTYVPSERAGIRLIRISDFLGDDPKYVKHTPDITRFLLQTDDILIAGTGATAGCTFKIPPHYSGLAYSYNAPCIRITENVCPFYISYYLSSDEVKQQQKRLFTGNAQPFLDTAAIGGFRILLPPLAEQRKIADILGCWDKAIEQARQLVEEKAKFKKGLMRRMLKDFDARNIPVYELNALFSQITRRGEIENLPALSITAGVGFVDQREKFSRVIAGESLSKYIHLTRGDFAYNKGNSDRFPFGCIYRLHEFDEGLVPFVYYCFAPKDKRVNPEFFQFYFEAGPMDRQLNRAINSGVRNDGLMNLSREDFFAAKIHLPSEDEQRKYGDLFSSCDRELNLLKAKRDLLINQKRGLMQLLLTGKKRVKV
jgi:type I restriction enzyme S subunit